MVSEKTVLRNIHGLHLHPAGMLCTEALKYECRIQIKKGNNTANAKSILGVLGTGIRTGDEFEIICDGMDEKEALQSIMKLIYGGLGEELP